MGSRYKCKILCFKQCQLSIKFKRKKKNPLIKPYKATIIKTSDIIHHTSEIACYSFSLLITAFTCFFISSNWPVCSWIKLLSSILPSTLFISSLVS